ncbi:MAG TPA: hypothetical protein DIV38_04740 [Clostridiales bacterium]|nr:hypothetical protein [Clostridiales bacterium]
MRVEICIGSSCHVKGATSVLNAIRSKVKTYGLEDKVELAGRFCMGKCTEGVCVTVDGQLYSVSPDSADEFFDKEIKGRL